MSAKDKANAKFEEGMSNFLCQDYDRGVQFFSEAINADPAYRLAFKSRGAAYLKLGKTREALADFNRIIEMDPDNAQAYHLRGLAYEKSGDNDKALEDFNKAIDLNSEYGSVYYSRANLHNKMGHAEMATEDIRMVNQLTEVNIETFANDSNIWRSHHLQLESMSGDDLSMER